MFCWGWAVVCEGEVNKVLSISVDTVLVTFVVSSIKFEIVPLSEPEEFDV